MGKTPKAQEVSPVFQVAPSVIPAIIEVLGLGSASFVLSQKSE